MKLKEFIEPFDDRIVVEPVELIEEKRGSIIIPQGAGDKPTLAKVLTVGPGRFSEDTGIRIPMYVKEGDVVLYSAHSGTRVQVYGEEALILHEEDVIARFTLPAEATKVIGG